MTPKGRTSRREQARHPRSWPITPQQHHKPWPSRTYAADPATSGCRSLQRRQQAPRLRPSKGHSACCTGHLAEHPPLVRCRDRLSSSPTTRWNLLHVTGRRPAAECLSGPRDKEPSLSYPQPHRKSGPARSALFSRWALRTSNAAMSRFLHPRPARAALPPRARDVDAPRATPRLSVSAVRLPPNCSRCCAWRLSVSMVLRPSTAGPPRGHRLRFHNQPLERSRLPAPDCCSCRVRHLLDWASRICSDRAPHGLWWRPGNRGRPACERRAT